MRIKFKLIPSNNDEWLGYFGDDLIKVRIRRESNKSLEENFFNFIERDLGISREIMNVLESRNKILHIELPDIAWELFLTIVK